MIWRSHLIQQNLFPYTFFFQLDLKEDRNYLIATLTWKLSGRFFWGFLCSDAQAEGIKPFTTDIFKGFLAEFLLDMGITSGKKLSAFLANGWSPLLFALIIPLVNGVAVSILSGLVTTVPGNRFLFAILGANASYIAVPAAMKLAAPNANPGHYISAQYYDRDAAVLLVDEFVGLRVNHTFNQ